MNNIKFAKLIKLSALVAFLLTSTASLFAGVVIDVTTLEKDASGRYTHTFTKETWDVAGSGTVNEKVCTTSFTYAGSEDITLYLDASVCDGFSNRGRYQGSITQTGTGKINVVWKTAAMRMGAPSVTTNYTGTTTFEGGPNLYLYDGTELGQGQLILNGGNVCTGWNASSGSTLQFNNIQLKGSTTFRAGWGSKSYNPPSELIFNGVVSGAGTLTYGGEPNPGAVTINSNNSYTGGTNINYNVQGNNEEKNTAEGYVLKYTTVSSNNSNIMYEGTAYAMRGALFTLNSNQPFGDTSKSVVVKNSPESLGSTAVAGTPVLWAFKTTDGSSAAVNRTFSNPISLEPYNYTTGRIVYKDSSKKEIISDESQKQTAYSHLYLLNDGAVSGSTYGTVTITSKITNKGTLHVLNKGFVLNPSELGDATIAVSSGDNPFGTSALNVTGNGTYSFQTPTDTKVTSVAHTVAHSEITIQNGKTFTISNADTTSLSVTPTTVTFKDGNSKLALQNTSAANAVTLGSDANRVTLSGGGKLDLSGTTGAKVYLTNNDAARNFSIVGLQPPRIKPPSITKRRKTTSSRAR